MFGNCLCLLESAGGMIGLFICSPLVRILWLCKFGSVPYDIDSGTKLLFIVLICLMIVINIICIVLVFNKKKLGCYFIFILAFIDYLILCCHFVSYIINFVSIINENGYYDLLFMLLLLAQFAELALIVLFNTLYLKQLLRKPSFEDDTNNIKTYKSWKKEFLFVMMLQIVSSIYLFY